VRLRLGLLLALAACSSKKEGPRLSSAAPNGSAESGTSAAAVVSAAAAAATSAEEEGEPAMAAPAQAVVDLAGVTNLPAPPGDAVAKVGAIGWVVRIQKRPGRDQKTLGFLRGGAIVATTGATARATKDCPGGWTGIAPGGFACNDELTTDLGHPILRAAARRPDFAEKLPYMYGTVTRGGPVYARIPSAAELASSEPSLDKHLAKWRDDTESGASYGLDVWLRYEKDANKPKDAWAALQEKRSDDDLPPFLAGGGSVPNLSGLVDPPGTLRIAQVDRRQGRSFVDTFLVEGRRYNLTPDLTIIPADRFRPIRGSDFHGWPIDREGIPTPFAIIRREGARKWTWSASKKKMTDAGDLEFRSLVRLTGKQKFFDNVLHFETSDGFYVDDRHASRVDPAKRWPKWAQQGGKWIDINLTKQVLVAYEGTKMVYATLVSSGEDGLADPDTAKKATVRGIYRIHTKWVSTTMDSREVGEEFELRDVPYVQYFKEGFALHGAYWHDRLGTPKSHGCVNLAPEDARRLFFWTEPSVPPGWHGAMKSLTGTVVFIHP
jgi:hypothetical protein